MTDQTTHDPERIVAAFREHNEQFLAAASQTWLEAADAFEETLGAVADAREKLPDATENERLSRLLHAHATFTREVVGACRRFTRELMTS